MGTYFKVSTAFIFSKSSVFPVLLYFYMAESNAFTRKQVLAIVKVMGNRNSENFQAEKQVWGFFFFPIRRSLFQKDIAISNPRLN